MSQDLLFTLTPKTGFYNTNNRMAYLDGGSDGGGKIACYHPANVGEPDGYVYYTYYPQGTINQGQLRIWANANPNQKIAFELDIETTNPDEKHSFFFLFAKVGGFSPLTQASVDGAKRTLITVDFTTDANGDALIAMYATKPAYDSYVFILRKINVFAVN